VAPELAAELVAEVADGPGALPLFEYALTERFDARAGGALTLAGYRGIGGLRGALARRADSTYDALRPSEQEVAGQVLLRLVTIGDGVDDTRRRVHRVDLEQLPLAPETVTTVLERFGRARLLAFDRDALSGMGTVEVAHEALLRAWPRLRSWIDEVRDDLRLHDSLAVAAAEWERADRRFPLDAYADPHARALAELLRKAVAEGTFRFDGSDLMPPTTVHSQFWGAMVEYVEDGPANLPFSASRRRSTPRAWRRVALPTRRRVERRYYGATVPGASSSRGGSKR
jgi:hypothetical protein